MVHPTRILFTALLFSASSLSAIASSVTYQYAVDTTVQSGNYGYVDFQLNTSPLATSAQPILADVFAFSGATLNPSDGNNDELGSVTGSLPDSVSFAADPGFNDYFEGLTFGTRVTFDVTLSGTGVSLAGDATNTGDTTFSVLFYDSTISNNLFVVDPTTGAAGEIDIQPDGTLVTTGGLTAVPEPASLTYLLCACLVALLSAVWRKRSATASS